MVVVMEGSLESWDARLLATTRLACVRVDKAVRHSDYRDDAWLT
jgi:hypothetical protein